MGKEQATILAEEIEFYQTQPAKIVSFQAPSEVKPENQSKIIKEKRKKKLKERAYIYNSSIIGLLRQNLKKREGTFGLKEAASLIVQDNQGQGIEISENFYGTFNRWVLLALDKAIVEKNPQILSPTSIASRGKKPDAHCSYQLTIADVDKILELSPEFYQKEVSFDDFFKQARKRLVDLRENNLSLFQITEDLLGYHSPKPRRRLEKMLLNGIFPLNGYPFLCANNVGIPKKFYQERLRPIWQKNLQRLKKGKRETLCPFMRMSLAKRKGTIYFLSTFFLERKELFDLEKRSIFTKYAAFYLAGKFKPFGINIEIARHSNRVGYYCFWEKDELKKLEELERLMVFLSENDLEVIFEKTKAILQNGFQTFKEYQECCPPDFLVSLTNALKILGIPIYRPAISANREEIKDLLASYEIVLFKKSHGFNKKTGNLRKTYHLTLDGLKKLVQAPNLKEEIGELLS